jgi:maltooligosyltrehalose trehalohydrolase
VSKWSGESALPQRNGATRLPDGSVRWRVWAPFAQTINLIRFAPDGKPLDVTAMTRETIEPEAGTGGYFSVTLPDIEEGQRYAYELDNDGQHRPDPCSLWQPISVQGPSAVVSTGTFAWTDENWRGIRREDLVIYELHVGTFTAAGTFEAVVDRLDALRELGVTAIEIMPVAQFPGDRNWGYDGVLPYAAQNSYGGPHELQKLVDAAHAKGLAVILDVVYNHFGPEHAYHREFGPYFTSKYKTPWGDAINYDDRGSDGVRQYVLDNARMWLEAFHLDGLRLDAVHAIYDLGAKHLLQELTELAHTLSTSLDRPITIIAESDLNDPRVLRAPESGGYGLDMQWSDDFHHAVHAFLTGERRGYYMEYGSAQTLASVLKSPFLTTGQFSPQRGRRHGAPPDGLAGDRFVVCIQNHDQVGNRAIGDRFPQIFAADPNGPAKLRLGACLMLFAPHIPMLFMGEEYAEQRPFPFFCSFGGAELIDAVRAGRRREFADFVDDPDVIPDPNAVATFESAKLTWSWPAGSMQADHRQLYRDLLQARRRWPALHNYVDHAVELRDNTLLRLIRGGQFQGNETLDIYFNLTDRPQAIPAMQPNTTLLFCSESAQYGGGRRMPNAIEELRPFECIAFGPAKWAQR